MRLFVLNQEMMNTGCLLCSEGDNTSCAAQLVVMKFKEAKKHRLPEAGSGALSESKQFLVNYGNPGPGKGDNCTLSSQLVLIQEEFHLCVVFRVCSPGLTWNSAQVTTR